MIEDEISDFTGALQFERAMSENTCQAYYRDLRRFAQFLKSRGIDDVRSVERSHIADFLGEERGAGMASSTRMRRTAAIRMFFRFLRERRRVSSDPTDLLDTPKRELVLPRVLSEEEVGEMIDAVSGTEPRELRDRAMLEVLYGAGLRVSEMCDLQMDDIIGDGELLRVIGKGSKERVVPIGHGAGNALNAYFASGRGAFARGNGYETHVFLTRLGRPFTRQGVFKVIRERAAAVGIAADRISPHVMRHSFASHMLRHGADIRAIQELLGHADIGTTQIYTHVDDLHLGEVHRKYHPRA